MSTTTRTRDPESDPAASRPRWLLPAVGVGAVAVIVVLGIVLFGGDDAATEPTLSDLPEGPVEVVGAEGNELLDLLEAGSALTFHASYAAQVADGEVSGALTLDIYRSEGNVRQDSSVSANGQTAQTRAIQTPDGTVTSCIEQDGTWTCAQAQQQADDLFGSLAQQLTEGDIETSTATILEMDATCWSLTDESGTSQLCVSADGIPLRITAADGTVLEITELERDVGGDAFDPPAEPVAAAA